MDTRSSWIVLFALMALGSAQASPAVDRSPFDVLSYGLALELDFDQSPDPGTRSRGVFSVLNTLEGEAQITVRNASERALGEVPLVLNRMMEVAEARVDGSPAAFDQLLSSLEDWPEFQVRGVTVMLPRPLPPGEEMTLSIRYGGQLVGYPETGMLYVRETLDPDFTILRPETFCYPQIAPLRDEAIGFALRNDRFDQRLKVTVPIGHVVVNGGRSTGVESRDGATVYSFESHEPDSTILLPVAPYRLLEAGEHRIYHFGESAAGVEKLAAKMGDALALFEAWFGPSRMDRGLVIAEIPEFFGSQAGPLIIQTSDAFNDPRQYGQFYHELSHLWNARDVDARPSRWNEGLATFLQALVEERLEGRDTLSAAMDRSLTRLRDSLEGDDQLATVAMADYGKEDMTGYSYTTGALMFGLLHSVVGERALLGFLGRYYQAHHETGSRDRDFIDSLGAALGDRAAEIAREWFSTADFSDRLRASADWRALRQSYHAPEK